MNPKIAGLITQYQVETNHENKETIIVTLWADFQPLVINLMRKFYIAREIQEDVSQDAFLKLLECAQNYDISQKVPFESYFKMQLKYWFLNRIRKKTELLVIDHDWSSGISMSDLIESKIGNAQEVIETNETQATFQKALETLTLKQKQAVVMYYIHGIPLTEVAKIMGCSYKVAYKHKGIGLKKIKKMF